VDTVYTCWTQEVLCVVAHDKHPLSQVSY